jgi:predicted metal-dependent HD superfamily phosphohydrolase
LSAEKFEDSFGRYVSAKLRGNVARLIFATDHRRARTGKDDESVLVDIDLSILAAPRPEYVAYAESIRAEYAFVADEAYRSGRAKVLRHFLDSLIFSTDHFASHESKARENMRWELEVLEAPTT